MGRKSLQNVSNLCFGAKDASDLFINQRMAQAKENFIHSLLNHLKFDLSSLELVFHCLYSFSPCPRLGALQGPCGAER